MAITSLAPVDEQDSQRLAQIKYLHAQLHTPETSIDAMRELNGRGYEVSPDPTGSGFNIKAGAGVTPPSGGGAVTPAAPTATPDFPPSPRPPSDMGMGMKSLLEVFLGGAGGKKIPAPGQSQTPDRAGPLSTRPATMLDSNGVYNPNQAYAPPAPSLDASPFTGAAAGAAGSVVSGRTPSSGTQDRAAVLNPPAASNPNGNLPQGQSAYSLGAPALDDRTDTTGHAIPGAQTFVRGLFATADNANKALDAYKKQNTDSTPDNDPQHKTLQEAVNASVAQATAGSKWAGMTQSARQSVLAQGEHAAGMQRATDKTQQMALEQKNAETDRRMGERKTTLLDDGKYFNDTGVMRGGAGENTSTTPGGGLIRTDPTSGAASLKSPYGGGVFNLLNPQQQAARPMATFDGKPKNQSPYFNEDAKRQLDEDRRKAEEERKKFASSIFTR